MKIYADNASTTFPKPPQVAQQMAKYITENGCNVSRGSYEGAQQAQEVLIETRCALASLFKACQPRNIIFTSGATLSINMLLQGLLQKGDHVITSSMEHNSVMRTLNYLEKQGVQVTVIECDTQGKLEVQLLEQAIKTNTKAVVTTHASNVCGTILPIDDINKICKKHKIFYIVDGAQSVGHLPITLENADAIAFAGHKGLYGPQGIGGFAIGDKLAQVLKPTIFGGTGSFSHLEEMPNKLPDKFEAGTLNIAGIYGLNEGVKFVMEKGISNILNHELMLTEKLITGIEKTNIKLLGINGTENRVGVVALDFKNQDNGQIAFRLEQEFGISTRCGLHCAPRAHKTLNSLSQGAVRFSFSFFNTEEQIHQIINAIKILTREAM